METIEIPTNYLPVRLRRLGLQPLASYVNVFLSRRTRGLTDEQMANADDIAAAYSDKYDKRCSCGMTRPTSIFGWLLHIDCRQDDREVRKFRDQMDRVL